MKCPTRRLVAPLAVSFLACLLCSVPPAWAGNVTVKNAAGQPLVLPSHGKTQRLSPGRTARLSESDAASATVQNLLAQGLLKVVADAEAGLRKKEKTARGGK